MNAAATQFDTAGWTIAQWQAAYLAGARPEALLAGHAAAPDAPADNAWILRVDGQRWRASWTNWRGCWRRRTGTCRACRCMACPTRSRTTSTSRAGRPPRLPRVRLHARRGCRAAPARRRRHPDRQDQSGPVRHRPGGHAFAARRGGQRVPARVHQRRIEFARPRWCARTGGVLAGHRHGRLGTCRRASTTSSDSSPRAAGQRRRRGAGLPHAGLRVGVRPDGRRRLARGRHRRRLRRARSLLRRAGRHGCPWPARPRFAVPDKLELPSTRRCLRCEPPAPSCGR